MRYTLVVVVAFLSLFSCEPKELRDCLEGEGSTVLVERTLEEINALSIDLPCAIEIYQDTNIRYGTVGIVAQRNVVNHISLTTRDSTATLAFDKCFKAHEDITLKFRIPNLNELTVNSAASLKTSRLLEEEVFRLILNESVSGRIVMEVDEFISEINSTADIRLEGYTPFHDCYIQSSGVIRAFDLITDSTYVEINGNGRAEIYIDKVADVVTSGGGVIRIKGDSTAEVRESLNGGRIEDLRFD